MCNGTLTPHGENVLKVYLGYSQELSEDNPQRVIADEVIANNKRYELWREQSKRNPAIVFQWILENLK